MTFDPNANQNEPGPDFYIFQNFATLNATNTSNNPQTQNTTPMDAGKVNNFNSAFGNAGNNTNTNYTTANANVNSAEDEYMNRLNSIYSSYYRPYTPARRKKYTRKIMLRFGICFILAAIALWRFAFTPGDAMELGNTFLDKGDYANAINQFTQAIQGDSKYAEAYNNRCYTYEKMNQFQLALQDCNQAVQLDPNNDTVYNNRCLVYWDLKNYQAALQDCNKSIQLNPNDAKTYNNRGLAYVGLQNLQAAFDNFSKSIQLDGSEPLYYYNRGVTYEKAGNIAAARSDFQQAANMGDADAKNALNNLH